MPIIIKLELNVDVVEKCERKLSIIFMVKQPLSLVRTEICL